MTLWTKYHAMVIFPTIAVGLLLGLLLSVLLKNKKEGLKNIPMQIVASVLIVLEVIKQILSIARGYDFYHLPLHICSLFVFLFPIMAFYRGKHKDAIAALNLTACTMLTLFMMICPAVVYSEWSVRLFFEDYFRFHTVVFHQLVLATFCIMLCIRRYTFNTKKDIKVILFAFSIFSVVSATCANVFKANLTNFYFSTAEPLENIRLSLNAALGGWGQVIWCVCVGVAIILFALLSYGLLRLLLSTLGNVKHSKDKAGQNA